VEHVIVTRWRLTFGKFGHFREIFFSLSFHTNSDHLSLLQNCIQIIELKKSCLSVISSKKSVSFIRSKEKSIFISRDVQFSKNFTYYIKPNPLISIPPHQIASSNYNSPKIISLLLLLPLFFRSVMTHL
jgi:hypothetical protein